MQRHVTTVHLKIKEIQCISEGCNQMFSAASDMRQHVKAVHLLIKDIPCTHEGCSLMFSRAVDMRKHVKAVHSQIRDIQCTHKGCNQMFSEATDMRRHVKAFHLQMKDVKCTDTICQLTFSSAGDMRRHFNTVHMHIKVPCTYKGCSQTFSQVDYMRGHVKAVHLQIKDIPCKHQGCSRMFSLKANMKQHYTSEHTKEGMNRKKKQEERLRKVLKEHYTVDEEIYIRYRDGCVADPDKYCAYVDFGLVGIVPAVTIVECDEWGHESYLVSCECSRMEQCSEAIIRAGDTRPIVFIRYNPNGKYTEDGKTLKVPRKERERKLLDVLAKIQSGAITFTLPINIIYLFYSTLDDLPEVCYDPDYSEQLVSVVYKEHM